MTLLRMLAFRPAAAAEMPNTAGGGGQVAAKSQKAAKPQSAPETLRASAAKPTVATLPWEEPDWNSLVATIGLTGTVRLLASNCVYLRRDGHTIHLGLDPRSESLLTRQRNDALAECLSARFGEDLKVVIELGADVGETPVQEESRMADERLEAARQTLEADPNVQALKNMFGAELNTDSIELINPPQSD
jgi:DNA polymerase-3 subunit gamma/tau